MERHGTRGKTLTVSEMRSGTLLTKHPKDFKESSLPFCIERLASKPKIQQTKSESDRLKQRESQLITV
jgi:hypothetical protein